MIGEIDSSCSILEQVWSSPEYNTQFKSIFSGHGSTGTHVVKHVTPGGEQNAHGSQFLDLSQVQDIS